MVFRRNPALLAYSGGCRRHVLMPAARARHPWRSPQAEPGATPCVRCATRRRLRGREERKTAWLMRSVGNGFPYAFGFQAGVLHSRWGRRASQGGAEVALAKRGTRPGTASPRCRHRECAVSGACDAETRRAVRRRRTATAGKVLLAPPEASKGARAHREVRTETCRDAVSVTNTLSRP